MKRIVWEQVFVEEKVFKGEFCSKQDIAHLQFYVIDYE